jgi:hypothetical protein
MIAWLSAHCTREVVRSSVSCANPILAAFLNEPLLRNPSSAIPADRFQKDRLNAAPEPRADSKGSAKSRKGHPLVTFRHSTPMRLGTSTAFAGLGSFSLTRRRGDPKAAP